LFADSKTELQTSLNVLYTYYNTFYYNNLEIEIVNKFTYVGIVFSTGGSCSHAQLTSSGQALKGIFKLNKQLNKFPILQSNIELTYMINLYTLCSVIVVRFGDFLRVHRLRECTCNSVKSY